MPSPISIQCPHCLQTLKLKSRKQLGRKVPCPKCKTPFVLEEPETEEDDFDAFDDFGDDDEYDEPPAPARRRRTAGSRGKGKRQKSKSAARPNWVLPVAIGGGVVGIVAIVGIVIWALGGTATPEQPVSTPTPELPVDDAATPLPDVTTVKKTLTPAQLAVGDPIENSIGMVLVPIPAGEFMMGPKSKEGRSDRETQHRVTLTKSFHLGRTEVTQGQWKAVMGTTPWKGKHFVKEGDDYAATYVSWNDAVEFCSKLSEKERVQYRLPTEAEWEYACRAGTTTAYSFGDNESQLDEYAWYNVYDTGEGPFHIRDLDLYAHIVGRKKINPWGLYDMHGNVQEWCQDVYDEYPSGDVTDPMGPTSGPYGVDRVSRGGCWSLNSHYCRSAFRLRGTPSDRDYSLGFRVLRSSAK